MREGIPSLRVLCLRAVGSHACSAEDTFAPVVSTVDDSTKTRSSASITSPKSLSTASRLLRSYHRRPVGCVLEHHATTTTTTTTRTTTTSAPPVPASELAAADATATTTDDDDYDDDSVDNNNNDDDGGDETTLNDEEDGDKPSIERIPLRRAPAAGKGSSRRLHANDVDLHHPFVAIRPGSRHRRRSSLATTSTPTVAAAATTTTTTSTFILRHGNPALDALQCYIDALVEMGRMDDTRLGRHFFEEYKANIILGHNAATARTKNAEKETQEEGEEPASKRRRTTTATAPPSLGALSLHNCSLSGDSIEAMVDSGIGPHLAVLDLTGIQGLSDDMAVHLLRECTHLQRLSLKNGRRLTRKSLTVLSSSSSSSSSSTCGAASLQCLDVGGCFNMTVPDVLDVLPNLPALKELYASGLGWTDEHLERLMEDRTNWKALSLGFSQNLTASRVRQHLMAAASSLQALALPFCENLVDNALLGMLGRNLPALQYLDLRGNPALSTLTGWYDGRASADLPTQALSVLGRYSGLTEASVEETKRINPLETVELMVVLDGKGAGLAIGYEEEEEGEVPSLEEQQE